MTIAICLKINDGLVLASDSATTIFGRDQTGRLGPINVYNNANKVFNLRKGLPIGAIAWGAGSIGHASVPTIIKDLRQRFTGGDPDHIDWKLKPDRYTVEDVASRLKEYVYDDLYQNGYRNSSNEKPDLGFIVAGYSARAPMADEFQIDIQNGLCNGPRMLRKREEAGMAWAGEPEALNRLIAGLSPALPPLLEEQLGVNHARMEQAIASIRQQIQLPVLWPTMPLQDAIDLGEFMVDLTVKISRFKLGPPTVGGPIEVAAISKHEGFRWVQRKYYFKRELNPEEGFEPKYEPEKLDPDVCDRQKNK